MVYESMREHRVVDFAQERLSPRFHEPTRSALLISSRLVLSNRSRDLPVSALPFTAPPMPAFFV